MKNHAAPRAEIDMGKLDFLRDKHAQLHAAYKSAAERARDLTREASLLAMEIAFEADEELAPVILSRDAVALAATTDDEVARARLDARLLRRLATARAAAARQRAVVEPLANQLRASTQLMAGLNEYAQRFEVYQ